MDDSSRIREWKDRDEILMEMSEAEEYETDEYEVHKKLIKGKHIVRKRSRVNRNEAFHSAISMLFSKFKNED